MCFSLFKTWFLNKFFYLTWNNIHTLTNTEVKIIKINCKIRLFIFWNLPSIKSEYILFGNLINTVAKFNLMLYNINCVKREYFCMTSLKISCHSVLSHLFSQVVIESFRIYGLVALQWDLLTLKVEFEWQTLTAVKMTSWLIWTTGHKFCFYIAVIHKAKSPVN